MQTNVSKPVEISYQSQIIQPTLKSQQPPNTQIQKQALQSIPLVPLRQAHKSMTTIRPSIFKSRVEESTSFNKDASSLIAKLDSLREIKTQESPFRHHKTTYIQPQSSVVLEFKNAAPKTVQLQSSVFASCVEPFRSSKSIASSSVSNSQQWSKTVPPQKNYEALIETLMKEQDTVVEQYGEKLTRLEQKVVVLSQENTNLMEQNKLLLTQNIELNEEITQWKNQVKQYLQQSQINSKFQNDIEILEKQLEYKQDELNQTISNLEQIKNINQSFELTIKEQQDQINSILQQQLKENEAYNSKIIAQKQNIQELESKVNQFLKNESSSQTLIRDLQNKLRLLEQTNERSKVLNQQSPSKVQLHSTQINVKDQYEYKQLLLELDSKSMTITEKETQVEALKIKNTMLQQQLIQLQACQLGIRDYESGLKQKQQEINELQLALQRKNQECDTLSQNQHSIINNKYEEYENIINELQTALQNKNDELEKVTVQLKTVKKEKAKLSMNLITAGMANLVMVSQTST